MLKIKGLMSCGGCIAEVDPWVPLKVSWDVERDMQPLYLLISGISGGYVELKLHPASGILMSLIVIDLPPEVQHVAVESPGEVSDLSVPVFDITAWRDVAEVSTERRVVKVDEHLTYSKSMGSFILGFSGEAPKSRIRCGDIWVDITESGRLVRLCAPV
jgi:hypothetical protein